MYKLYKKLEFEGYTPQDLFGHSITYYTEDKLCLYGGAIGAINQMIITDNTFTLDMSKKQWRKIQTTGISPSARAGHAAACVQKNKIVIYGGATKQGLASDQLYLLDLKEELGIWNIVNIRHKTPGKRYGHTLTYNAPHLIIFGGNLQIKVTNDLWILNTHQKKLEWREIKCKNTMPCPRDYHSASLSQSGDTSGMIIIFGGRSEKKEPLNDSWGLVRHNSTGQWSWEKTPNKSKTNLIGRYQHTSHFIQNLMFIVGGRGENELIPYLILKLINGHPLQCKINLDMPLGIIKKKSISMEGFVLNNLDKQQKQIEFFRRNQAQQQRPKSSDISTKVLSSRKNSNSRLTIQSKSPIVNKIQSLQKRYSRSKQPKLTQYLTRNQSSKKITILPPAFSKIACTQIKKPLSLKQNIAKYFLNKLLRPKQFSEKTQLNFGLKAEQIINLCDIAEQIISSQPILLKVRAPCKIFGDIHGQFSDLMQFFKLYGTPHENNERKDIQNYDYIFLGDYVDRGSYSLQTICMLLSLKIIYPNQVHLLRGNHEDAACNADFGFLQQCQNKMDEDPCNVNSVYVRINRLFEWFPLAVLAQQKILCVHGGIGKQLKSIEQILQIKRPLQIKHQVIDKQSQIVIDLLWSDPTQSDQIHGIHPNFPRDPRCIGDIVRFGPDRVHSFLKNNNLSLIIRAHQCVMDGIQRFADGALITVFTATDYGQKHKNAGGMLVLKTNLQLIPKIIYPKQKNVQTWLQQDVNQRPLTPPRWRKLY